MFASYARVLSIASTFGSVNIDVPDRRRNFPFAVLDRERVLGFVADTWGGRLIDQHLRNFTHGRFRAFARFVSSLKDDCEPGKDSGYVLKIASEGDVCERSPKW